MRFFTILRLVFILLPESTTWATSLTLITEIDLRSTG